MKVERVDLQMTPIMALLQHAVVTVEMSLARYVPKKTVLHFLKNRNVLWEL